MSELPTIQLLAIILLPLILAVTMHEAAHGWVADKLGDPTARDAGRISLNPIPHIDLVGTLLVPIAMMLTAKLAVGVPLLFGWAKPVPVDMHKLRHPRRDMAFVAIAGPLSNLVMATLWLILARNLDWVHGVAPEIAGAVHWMALFGVLINLFLFAFNLLPIPPLDGGRIVTAMLPYKLALPFSRLERWGLIIVLLLVIPLAASGYAGIIIGTLQQWLVEFVALF